MAQIAIVIKDFNYYVQWAHKLFERALFPNLVYLYVTLFKSARTLREKIASG